MSIVRAVPFPGLRVSSRSPRNGLRTGRRATVPMVALLIVAATLAGCRSGDPGVPTGDAKQVLDAAPDRTVEHRRFLVDIASDVRELSGEVDFGARSGTAEVRKGDDVGSTVTFSPDAQDPHDPFYALEVARHVATIYPVGGRQVRGTTALEYEVYFEPGEGQRFKGEVFVDRDGVIRRLVLPRVPNADPPVKNARGFLAQVTIDLLDPPATRDR